MADSSNASEEPLVTTATTAMQDTPESSEPMNAAETSVPVESSGIQDDIETDEVSGLVQSSEANEQADSSEASVTQQTDGIEHKVEVDSNDAKPDEGIQGLPQQMPEETSNVDSSTTFHTEQDQQTYANLEPILVAMELGQEILQSSSGEQSQTTEDGKSTVVQMEVQQSDSDGGNIPQSDSTADAGSSVVAITQEQLASLFANSGAGGGGNVIVTSLPSDGSAGQGGLSLATILQDVVSGMQQTSSNGGATVLADSTGSAGSYYLVTQGGTIPIVMPSNIGSSGVTSMNLVQASSTDPTTFVTVNPEALPEGVDVMAATVQTTEGEGRSAHLSTVQGSAVDSSGISEGETITETVSSDHELASAAAAVENDRTTLQEAVTSPVPVVTTTVKRRLSNGPRVCEQCNKAFKYPSDLKKHLQIHTDIKKFKCDECNRYFRRLHQLIVHQRIHSGEKPYICKHCGTAFRHDSTLTMHVRTRHEHKRPFKCDFCEHTFGRLSHLRKHVKKVCGPDKQEKQASTIFQCKFCEVVFSSKIELRKHTSICEKKESKAKPSQVALHVCNICNKDFASPYNVRRHQLTHSDDRPFECEYCSKSFKEKSSLTKHVKRVHLGKNKDESLEGSSTELVVSISNQDQQFDVVPITNDENLLDATVQSSTGVSAASGNSGETSTVDSTTLVQVAASVMVEELLHGEDQNQEASCTSVTTTDATSGSQQNIFIAESDKSDLKMQEADSYDGQLEPDASVSLPETSSEVAASEAPVSSLSAECLQEGDSGQVADSSGLSQSDVQVTSSQYGDEQQDTADQGESVEPVESSEVEECPGEEPVQSAVEPMVLGNDPDDEVVTSSGNTSEQVPM